jgi:uncharacterized phage protein (TIGR02218 family)
VKTLSPALQTHLSKELTTLATLVKITRVDGAIYAFTSFDKDIVISGVTYKADGSFQASAIQNRAALSTDNLDIIGLLDSTSISEADLRAGLYDHARIDVYLCNWADVTQGTMQLRRGWLGEVKINGGKYEAELRGLHDLLQRPFGKTYSPECRYGFGDASCKINLATYTVTGSASSITDNARFTDTTRSEPDGIFNYGLLTWLTGANAGLAMEVKSFIAKQFTFWLPMPNAIAIGDTYSVYKGCNKRFATCQSVFNNAINFGGFPYMPGVDRILNYPDARS